ncbi:MAG TPA: NUDIX hydrolase [Bradyrhizobium sp.]|nr:NUDIX hydrolase [Bradyrhizobium sp.]
MSETELMQRFSSDAQPGHANVQPRDASTLILLDRSGPSPKVLMGKRHHGHVFMPGKFVFPGGRVDPSDRKMPVGAPLDPRAEAKLMLNTRRPSAVKARGLALAAIRETFEETGLLLGSRRDDAPTAPAGGAWAAFAEAHIHPDLSTVHFIARAITPPNRTRRYDTRFFTADATAIAHKIDGKVSADAELVELVWVPLDGIKEKIALLAITEIVLRDLNKQIEAGFSHELPVPFYRVKHGKRVREFL